MCVCFWFLKNDHAHAHARACRWMARACTCVAPRARAHAHLNSKRAYLNSKLAIETQFIFQSTSMEDSLIARVNEIVGRFDRASEERHKKHVEYISRLEAETAERFRQNMADRRRLFDQALAMAPEVVLPAPEAVPEMRPRKKTARAHADQDMYKAVRLCENAAGLLMFAMKWNERHTLMLFDVTPDPDRVLAPPSVNSMLLQGMAISDVQTNKQSLSWFFATLEAGEKSRVTLTALTSSEKCRVNNALYRVQMSTGRILQPIFSEQYARKMYQCARARFAEPDDEAVHAAKMHGAAAAAGGHSARMHAELKRVFEDEGDEVTVLFADGAAADGAAPTWHPMPPAPTMAAPRPPWLRNKPLPPRRRPIMAKRQRRSASPVY